MAQPATIEGERVEALVAGFSGMLLPPNAGIDPA